MGCGYVPPVVAELEPGGSAAPEMGGEHTETIPEPVLDWTAFLTVMQLVETSTGVSRAYSFKHVETGADVGYLHYMGKDLLSQKATCRSHASCVCWVQLRASGLSPMSLLRSQVEWLAAGHGVDKEKHQALAVNLKRRWGMKPLIG